MNNAFYFILKAFSPCFRYLHFCVDGFGYVGRWLDKKAKVISKCKTLQTGTQTIIINILSDISKRKGNQTLKIGQLIE